MPLKVTRRHGSPYLYLRGSIRGIRVDQSTGTGDPDAAEQIRIKTEAALLKRSIHGDAVSRTFNEGVVSYLEAGGDATHLTPALLSRLGRKPLADMGQAAIEETAKALLPKASPATRNRQVFTPVSAVLHHCARKGWCPKPVIARPKQPKGRVRWIDHDEAERLIAAASPHLSPLIVFLLSTGARIGEALSLDWRDVDLSRCHVVFRDTKNGEDRGVPLHARAVAALANLPGRKGAVFRRPDGKPYAERIGGGGMLKTAWAGMLRRSGIRDFTPHDCRHTWATWHYAANRDLGALMELGGWKSPAMVFRYAHVNTAHLAPSMGGIWGKSGESAVVEQSNTLSLKAKSGNL